MSENPQPPLMGRVAGLVGASILLSVLLGGCATSRQLPRTIPSDTGVEAETVAAPLPQPVAEPVIEKVVRLDREPEPEFEASVTIEEIPLIETRRSRVRRSRPVVVEPTYDMPIEITGPVRSFIEQYSRPYNRKNFEAAMTRSGRYMEMFRRIFAEEGVPRDMVYMAHVESGYKTNDHL